MRGHDLRVSEMSEKGSLELRGQSARRSPSDLSLSSLVDPGTLSLSLVGPGILAISLVDPGTLALSLVDPGILDLSLVDPGILALSLSLLAPDTNTTNVVEKNGTLA